MGAVEIPNGGILRRPPLSCRTEGGAKELELSKSSRPSNLDQLLHAIKQHLNGREIPVPLPHYNKSRWLEEQGRAQAERQAA